MIIVVKDLEECRIHLRKVRRNLDISQQELADRCGLARGTISRFELGLVDIQFETLLRLTKELGITLIIRGGPE